MIHAFEQLPSRRNSVYKIFGTHPSQSTSRIVIAKFFRQSGIAHETSILQWAHRRQIPVPKVLGTTSEVLLLEYIDAPNLCDLITLKPDPLFGHLLASWLANFHRAFQRSNGQVLLKGDARIRNFLVFYDHLYGVDFEDSQPGPPHNDLAITCASILDTNPIFTHAKLRLCTTIIQQYAISRQISNMEELKSKARLLVVKILRNTAKRRGNPSALLESIKQFEKGALSF